MADVVSLLPGTLSADLAEGSLTIHVLDRNMPVHAEFEALEERVAAMLEAGVPRPTLLKEVGDDGRVLGGFRDIAGHGCRGLWRFI